MRRIAILALAATLITGLGACGSSSKSSSPSSASTTVAAPPTTSAAQAAKPIKCDGKDATVTEIGQASAFKPITPDTLTVVTSLPGPGFGVGSDSDPAKATSGYWRLRGIARSQVLEKMRSPFSSTSSST